MNFDYLVVGQGLAGTILTATLQAKGLRVLVVDQNREVSSSKIAAGLINPIAGKRLARSWRIDELLPAARQFYRELEQTLDEKLFHSLPLVKLFASVAEQNDWLAKTADPGYAAYVQEDPLTHPETVQQQHGKVQITGGGYVDLERMLHTFRERLRAQDSLLEEAFDFSALQLLPEGVRYRQTTARAVLFCEGYQAVQNPYFSWLPLVPTKGEILEVALKDFNSSCIYNRGVYVVPSEAGPYRIGATYNWREPNEVPTEEGARELLEKAAAMVAAPLPVLRHRAAIRPAVRDRRPLIGFHPQHRQLAVFNGMGSKGVLMAPFFAARLAEALADGQPLDPEVDVARYFSLFTL